jgi:U3 small nucleolar RNA-associated protein 18
MYTNLAMNSHIAYDCISLGGSAIASASNGSYFGVGSNTGVVNLYDWNSLKMEAPSADSSVLTGMATPRVSPVKAFMNLTTPIDFIKFNHDAQVRAFGIVFL